jgi:hypothetical protein
VIKDDDVYIFSFSIICVNNGCFKSFRRKRFNETIECSVGNYSFVIENINAKIRGKENERK